MSNVRIKKQIELIRINKRIEIICNNHIRINHNISHLINRINMLSLTIESVVSTNITLNENIKTLHERLLKLEEKQNTPQYLL
jgi:hypothetical protein